MQMSDMLNWAFRVAPGVVLCKDESFLAGWKLTGIDSESIDPVELNVMFERVARGVSQLQEGDALWVTLKRARSVPVVMDGDALMDKSIAVSVIVAENSDMALDEVLFENEIHLVYRGTVDEDPNDLPRRLESFDRQCEAIETVLGSTFDLRRLGENMRQTRDGKSFAADELTDLLASMASGRSRQQRITDQDEIYLDVALGADFLQDDLTSYPRIDGREAALLNIEVWPEEHGVDALAALETIECDYRWTVRFVIQSASKTRAKVNALRRKWRQSGSNMLANIVGREARDRDVHADILAQGLDGVSLDLGQGLRFGDLTSTITIFADEDVDAGRRLRQSRAAISQTLMDAGFQTRIEYINAQPTYLGSLPGHMMPLRRSVLVSAYNFATLIPCRSFWQGERFCPCPPPKFAPQSPPLMLARSARGELFQFNLHSGDTGHTIVVGPTGGGKSVLLGALAANFLKYPDAQVFYFDKYCSSRHLCNAVGGSFIEFGADATQGIAPLGDLREVGLEWGQKWLRQMAKMTSPMISEGALAELDRAVENLIGSRERGGSLETFSDFVLSNENKQVLSRYIGKGDAKGTLNGTRSDIEWKDMTVFEAENLFSNDDTTAILALDYIFRRVERRLTGRPTMIIFDEAASFLRHEIFRQKIDEWLRELRKMNVSVVMASQQVEQFTDSVISSSFQNVSTYVFLANAGALGEKSAAAYKTLGLSNSQIEQVANMAPKREYYVVKPAGSRVLDFRFGPRSLYLLSQTDKEISEHIKTLAAENPNYWLNDLRESKLSISKPSEKLETPHETA